MIVIDKTQANFAPISLPTARGAGGSITNVIKRRYMIKRDGSVDPYTKDNQHPIDGDIHYKDEIGRSVRHPSDIPEHKPLVDLVINGQACAPSGSTTDRLKVAFELAGFRKELAVSGDRYWKQTDDGSWYISDPEPFARMPVRWEKSFGSLYDMRNPMGKGGDADPQSDPADPDYPLPNVEDTDNLITDPLDSPDPANFGAIPPYWQSRDKKYGTRDMFWATFRAPELPRDHDLRYHNAAPDDQQFERLRGDETIVFENMDPEQPTKRVQLPGTRPRLFYVPRDDAARELREIPIAFDTIVADLDVDEMTLVWRGVLRHSYTSVQEDIAYMYLQEEPITQRPVSREHYQKLFEKEIPQYERVFDALNMSGERMHNQIFGPIVEQIVKSLEEVEADEALIGEFRQAETAQELLDLAEKKSHELGEQIQTMLKNLE